jgi:hypothetical protein
MSSRFEHESGSDPIILREKMLASLAHGAAFELWTALLDNPNRVAAGVSVDAGEGVNGHG